MGFFPSENTAVTWAGCVAAVIGFAAATASGQGGPDFDFFGLEHTLLGQAQQSANANGHLVISNIGDSGDDGYEILEEGPLGYTVLINLGSAAGPGVRADMDNIALDAPAGAPPASHFSIQGNELGGFDFSFEMLAPDGSNVEVEYIPYLGDVILEIPAEIPNPGEIGSTLTALPQPIQISSDHDALTVVFPIPISFSGPDGETITLDRFDLVPASPVADAFEKLRVTAAGVDQIVVENEALSLFDSFLNFFALGDAEFEPVEAADRSHHLTISNMGASGDDGFLMDVSPSSEAFVTLDPQDPPSGTSLNFRTQAETQASVTLEYLVLMTYTGSLVSFDVDWGTLYPTIPGETCKLLLEGVCIGTVPCDFFVAVSGCTAESSIPDGPNDDGLWVFSSMSFDEPVEAFDAAGAPLGMIDRIEFGATEPPPAIPDTIQSIDVTGTGPDIILLPAAGALPELPGFGCDADFNDDDELNVLDFIAFQQAFQNQDPAADINDDGVWNVLDFIAFQAEFEQGC